MNGDEFGDRLRKLINDRTGSNSQFADDLGISLTYLLHLMEEPFAVSNPSARLLKRMAVLLSVPVGFLLGESEESDGDWVESNASWRSWLEGTAEINAKVAFKIRDEWRDEFRVSRREQPSVSSFRKPKNTMRESDWEKRYQLRVKAENGKASQGRLL